MNIDYPDKGKYLKCLEDIGRLLYRTSCVFQSIEKDFVRNQGISTSQATLLILLLGSEDNCLNMTKIISEMNLEKSSVTRLIENLLEKGYVEKNKNREDKREIKVCLTKSGKIAADKVKNLRMDYYNNILKRLPKGQVREVMNSFEMLLDAFTEEK